MNYLMIISTSIIVLIAFIIIIMKPFSDELLVTFSIIIIACVIAYNIGLVKKIKDFFNNIDNKIKK